MLKGVGYSQLRSNFLARRFSERLLTSGDGKELLRQYQHLTDSVVSG